MQIDKLEYNSQKTHTNYVVFLLTKVKFGLNFRPFEGKGFSKKYANNQYKVALRAITPINSHLNF